MWIDWIILPLILALALFFVVRHFWNQSQGKTECKSCKSCENAVSCIEMFETAGQPDNDDADPDDECTVQPE